MTRVLVTGGSGFIASHIVENLLASGHFVVTTVRSEQKAKSVQHLHAHKGRLEVAVVPDIAAAHAFDEVVSKFDIEIAMHLASPFRFVCVELKKDMVDPSILGTLSLLDSLHRCSKTTRRVIITSSFAAMLDENKMSDNSTVFTEKSWNPTTLADAELSPISAYHVAKTLAEQAAWDFVKTKSPAFDLVSINPPLVFGPLLHRLPSPNHGNTKMTR